VTLLLPRLAFADSRSAVSVDGEVLDYRSLARAAAGHASDLRRRGIVPGDRVGVVTHGTLDTIAALVGNAQAGVVTVPINPKLGTSELEHVLGDARPKAVYVDADASRVAGESLALPPDRRAVIRVDEVTGALPSRHIDDEPLFVLYTSGTTGKPKGALLTARNVASNLDGLARAWQWTDADTVVHALPLFHVHGLVLGLFGSLRVGCELAHLARFDPVALATELARPRTDGSRRGGTMLFAVPTMYHRLVEAAETTALVRDGLRAARLLVSGSAALTVREHRRIEALTGRGVHERYGLTESLICCAVPSSHPPRAGYVGLPVPGVQVRLVDDDRRPLDCADDATIGEVAVRGPSIFGGYLNRDDATRAVLEDGWFYTGDLATRASDGFFRIVGRRATDLIKTGGFKVGAGEIEACLLEHPAVGECAVVGIEDEDLGERIVAFVVLCAGHTLTSIEDELIAFVAERLSSHKRPRSVVTLDALPRNPMGKVLKKQLRA
jgi:malonyl-CoA/methylmalonyl-CoA synthetase